MMRRLQDWRRSSKQREQSLLGTKSRFGSRLSGAICGNEGLRNSAFPLRNDKELGENESLLVLYGDGLAGRSANTLVTAGDLSNTFSASDPTRSAMPGILLYSCMTLYCVPASSAKR